MKIEYFIPTVLPLLGDRFQASWRIQTLSSELRIGGFLSIDQMQETERNFEEVESEDYGYFLEFLLKLAFGGIGTHLPDRLEMGVRIFCYHQQGVDCNCNYDVAGDSNIDRLGQIHCSVDSESMLSVNYRPEGVNDYGIPCGEKVLNLNAPGAYPLSGFPWLQWLDECQLFSIGEWMRVHSTRYRLEAQGVTSGIKQIYTTRQGYCPKDAQNYNLPKIYSKLGFIPYYDGQELTIFIPFQNKPEYQVKVEGSYDQMQAHMYVSFPWNNSSLSLNPLPSPPRQTAKKADWQQITWSNFYSNLPSNFAKITLADQQLYHYACDRLIFVVHFPRIYAQPPENIALTNNLLGIVPWDFLEGIILLALAHRATTEETLWDFLYSDLYAYIAHLRMNLNISAYNFCYEDEEGMLVPYDDDYADTLMGDCDSCFLLNYIEDQFHVNDEQYGYLGGNPSNEFDSFEQVIAYNLLNTRLYYYQ